MSDDDMFLEVSVNGEADGLITFNQRDFASAVAARGAYPVGAPRMSKKNFTLRVQPSLLEEARKAAEAAGVELNQFVNVAIAEKVSALRTERYFRERAARGDLKGGFAILDRSGVGNPPQKGDER